MYLAGLVLNLTSTSLFTKNKLYIITNLAIFFGFVIFGYFYHLKNNTSAILSNNNVRIVQPNTLYADAQIQKQDLLNKINLLSTGNGKEDIDLLIWPEGSIPFSFSNSAAEIKFWQYFLPSKKNSTLIFGIEHVKNTKYHNSLLAIDHDNIATYDKKILVPFGEYIPLLSILPTKISSSTSSSGFSPGNGINHLMINKFNILPLICSESILDMTNFNVLPHSHYDFILNISNDSWFRGTLGPEQHFALSRIRAIEYGLPVIRAGNNGPSAFINSHGEVLKRTHTDVTTVLDGEIPKKIDNATVFYKYKHLFFFFAVFCYLAASIANLLLINIKKYHKT